MTNVICFINLLSLVFGSTREDQDSKSVFGVPIHHFELLAAENPEEVSEGVFLIEWIGASFLENDSEVLTIPVDMDEPYVYWVQ
jgi:hypothetical protein